MLAPGRSDGGGGNGCARLTNSSVSLSSTLEPELLVIRLAITRPCRSRLKASCAVPCSCRFCAAEGYRLFFSRRTTTSRFQLGMDLELILGNGGAVVSGAG